MSGNADQSWDDFPFGEGWSSSGGGSNQHRFTGHIRGDESGQEYAGARYYSSAFGRWGSIDPLLGSLASPQSFNRYTYVHNDPVNYYDPDGREEYKISITVVGEVPQEPSPPPVPQGMNPLEELFAGSFASWFESLTFELYLQEPSVAVSPEAVSLLATVSRVKDRLAGGPCSDFFGENAGNVLQEMMDTSKIILASKGVPADPRDVNLASYTPGAMTITINSDGPFMNPSNWAIGGGQTADFLHFFNQGLLNASPIGAFSPLSATQFQELILMHELAHRLGKYHLTIRAVTRQENKALQIT